MHVWEQVRSGPLTGHQLILERRDPPADVCLWDGLHKESSLCRAETVHRAQSLVLLRQQHPQIPVMLQIHMRALNVEGQEDTRELHASRYHGNMLMSLLYLGVSVGFDARVKSRRVSRRGLRVWPQVDKDGPCGVEPLQRALRAAQVDLLHVPAVRLMAQTTADENIPLEQPTNKGEPWIQDYKPLTMCR